MAHVFISYAHEDGDFGYLLINRLKEEGITHWVDSEHLRAGEDWRQKIDDAIRDSFALIVVMSPAAKASEYVTYEWAFAWGLGIQIIPVLYKDTKLHPRLEAWQYLDFTQRTARPWDRLIADLSTAKIQAQRRTPKESQANIEQANIEETKEHIKMLREASSPVKRRMAAQALGFLRNQLAIPALSVAANDLSSEVRVVAVWALGQIGDPRAIPAIVKSLVDYDKDKKGFSVSTTAVEALGHIGTTEALEAIEKWKQERETRSKDLAQKVVQNLLAQRKTDDS